MSHSDSSDTMQKAPLSGTKFCHITKRADFDGYGFNLHSEKSKPGQYIGKVDDNSPASEAGLKEGDRIIEVNGVPIRDDTHKHVVQRIKSIANEVRLLLIAVDDPQLNKINTNSDKNQGTVQEIPGASANISSISMISTKRSLHKSTNQTSAATVVPVPPPTLPPNADFNGISSNKNVKGSPNANEMTTNQGSSGNTKQTADLCDSTNGREATDTLQLQMTAAEMRAKLLSKKKYDPKNESVDLRKKFEIIQKL